MFSLSEHHLSQSKENHKWVQWKRTTDDGGRWGWIHSQMELKQDRIGVEEKRDKGSEVCGC